jgi:hypothetical protein
MRRFTAETPGPQRYNNESEDDELPELNNINLNFGGKWWHTPLPADS